MVPTREEQIAGDGLHVLLRRMVELEQRLALLELQLERLAKRNSLVSSRAVKAYLQSSATTGLASCQNGQFDTDCSIHGRRDR